MKILLYVVCMMTAVATHSAELVASCRLGSGAAQSVAVMRDSPAASTHIYYLQQGRKRTAFFGTTEQSRGSSVLVQCVGNKHRALIISGEFTANAVQGFVLTYPFGQASPERLDFAEKSRPGWLYLGSDEMRVVVTTGGYGETNAKYVMYRHVIGQADDEPARAINELPSSAGFEMISLKDSSR
ncbi:hypothetical protein [Duganella levis]|uniref:Uncharacterized protein n=1 Tax=Duganella levis TaxID=2692169 RepID=A0ABW9W845_9BURK|nr:hypothetical protein [Duganella levis]MYN30173.1 hypothetical protein [Duganella levis]